MDEAASPGNVSWFNVPREHCDEPGNESRALVGRRDSSGSRMGFLD